MTKDEHEKLVAAVNEVADEDVREALVDAWRENVRLRRLLSAMVEVDDTQVGIVEVYATHPQTKGVAGMGLVVCCPGDERALAEACAGALHDHFLKRDGINVGMIDPHELGVPSSVKESR